MLLASRSFGCSAQGAPIWALGNYGNQHTAHETANLPAVDCGQFLVGWFIPAFYDWTGSDQSRPSPLIGQTALGLIAGGIIVCLVLPWLPITCEPRNTDRAVRVRFKTRTLLLMTAAVAVVIAALMKVPMVVSGGLYGIVLCYVLRFWVLFRPYRWQTAALLACMYLPFAWIVPYDQLSDILPAILWMASGLPAIFPTMLVGSLVQKHSQELVWLSMLLIVLSVTTFCTFPREFSPACMHRHPART